MFLGAGLLLDFRAFYEFSAYFYAIRSAICFLFGFMSKASVRQTFSIGITIHPLSACHVRPVALHSTLAYDSWQNSLLLDNQPTLNRNHAV